MRVTIRTFTSHFQVICNKANLFNFVNIKNTFHFSPRFRLLVSSSSRTYHICTKFHVASRKRDAHMRIVLNMERLHSKNILIRS